MPASHPRFRRSKSIAILLLALVCPSVGRSSASEHREHVVERTYSETLRYRCLVNLPDDYEVDAERHWPLILFLHGGGALNVETLKESIGGLTGLPAIVVTPICPPSKYGERYTNWDSMHLGEVVREIGKEYRIDAKRRSVVGFSMGGSGAWELPSYENKLFAKSVVIAGLCHPWSLRHYSTTQVWVFVGAKDYMRKEQQETVTSAKRFKVDVVETVWEGEDHAGIFRRAMSYQRMLDWLVSDEDLRVSQHDADAGTAPKR
ncbi:Putative esterase [Roseimaritima multifibrata]|uniref:Esterase n=2 Tax=Roseimaritima multifibrata TaxID=1930274 RepID=A0A517MEQ2_9BACT|nr:Putative esterase [Roseimaritima multifibrata]